MLKTLRNPKYVKRIMLWTLIFIIPAFVLFYGWSSLTSKNDTNLPYAAKVNGTEISIPDFQSEYNRYLEQVKQTYGDKFNDQMAAELNLAGQVLDELENRSLVLEEAKKLGIDVSDNELSAVIQSNQAFQENGRFNPNVYVRVLASQQLSPQMFEQEMKTDRMYGKTRMLITDFVKVTEPEIREEFRREFEKITVDAIRYSVGENIQSVNVDDKEADTYYNSHQRDYQIPPQYNLAYLTINPKSYEKDVQITDKDIKDYYDNNLETFATPEKVHVRHILAELPSNPTKQQVDQAQERMKRVIQKLKNGEPFEQVAKEESQDSTNAKNGGDLGWIKRGDTVPEFEQQAFSTVTGTLSQPFQTKFGYHILKVEEKEASRIQKLDEVKNAIIENLKIDGGDAKAQSLAEQILKEAGKQSTITELADKHGYAKGSTGWFSGESIPGFEDNKDLSSILLTLSQGAILQEPIKTTSGYHIFQLVGKQESRIPKFEEVKTQVRAQIMFQKAQELALKKSQEAEKLVKSGASLEDIASKTGSKATMVGPFSVDDDISGIGKRTAVALTAFNLPEGKTSNVISIPDPIKKGLTEYFIIRVKSKTGASESNYIENKDQLELKVLNQKKQIVFQEWVQTLRKRAKIEPNKSFMEGYQTKS